MQNPGQPNYQDPTYAPQQYYSQQQMAPVVTVKEWMLTFLILLIPIVNIVMMFVWAFGGGNPSKANYFKASLLWAAIVIVIYIVIVVMFIGTFTAMFS